MALRIAQDRNLVIIFTVVCLLHALLLTIPDIRRAVVATVSAPVVSVRLRAPEPMEPEPAPRELEIPMRVPLKPLELADLPEAEPPPPEPRRATPDINASRILLELEEKRQSDPLATMREDQSERPDYYVRHRPALVDVLNEPSLQLPFDDDRIYLLDSYDPGFIGGVQRFFDEVTVPFGFTTKSNTRVQCAWILVIAGCSWADVSYHYTKQKPKKRKPNL